MGACAQSHTGTSTQEISRASRQHTLWKAGGDRRADGLSGIPGSEMDDRNLCAYGWRRNQSHLSPNHLQTLTLKDTRNENMENRDSHRFHRVVRCLVRISAE